MPQSTKARTTLRPEPVSLPADDWPVDMQLTGGRRERATFVPPLARSQDLAALARVSAANDRRSFAALERQRVELRDLKRSHEELSQRFAALQEQSERVVSGLLSSMAGMERRVETAVTQSQKLLGVSRSARALAVSQRQELRAIAIRAGLDKVTAAVNTAQAAAFGQRGSLTAPNNLTLLANQLAWSFMEPVLRGLGIQTGVSPGAVDFLAPLGALLTGQIALSNGQHARFVTGVAAFEGSSFIVSESLRGKVADSFFTKLRQRADVAVSLTPLDPVDAVFSARVEDGTLSIMAMVPNPKESSPPHPTLFIGPIVPPGVRAPRARVAWMVDLGGDVG